MRKRLNLIKPAGIYQITKMPFSICSVFHINIELSCCALEIEIVRFQTCSQQIILLCLIIMHGDPNILKTFRSAKYRQNDEFLDGTVISKMAFWMANLPFYWPKRLATLHGVVVTNY